VFECVLSVMLCFVAVLFVWLCPFTRYLFFVFLAVLCVFLVYLLVPLRETWAPLIFSARPLGAPLPLGTHTIPLSQLQALQGPLAQTSITTTGQGQQTTLFHLPATVSLTGQGLLHPATLCFVSLP
jgi:hypothetical protein